jgi:hypothetical protein
MATVPLICIFCNRETYFDYREILTEEDYYKCIHCPHEVRMCQCNEELTTISMKIQISDKFYVVDLWTPDFWCSVHEISERGNWLGTVFELNFVPLDWNPTNIEAKLKTALTFL